MIIVLVANTKGGCGKTTVSTHLAAAFAGAGQRTALADADRQRSSLEWTRLRPGTAPPIAGLDWSKDLARLPKGFDRLVIDGAASGSTSVDVFPAGDIFINTTGVLVVDTVSTTAGAFELGTTPVGLINLDLIQVGQDFFLTSTPNLGAIEPVVIGDLAQNLWYQSADIYSNYAALRRTDLGVARTSNLGVWGQAYWSKDKTDDEDVTLLGTDFFVDRVETKRTGIQAGVDYLLGTNAVIGLTGGYERADLWMSEGWATVFTNTGGNITASSTHTGEDRVAILRYEVELSDPSQLPKLLADLRGVDGVFSSFRLATDPAP